MLVSADCFTLVRAMFHVTVSLFCEGNFLRALWPFGDLDDCYRLTDNRNETLHPAWPYGAQNGKRWAAFTAWFPAFCHEASPRVPLHCTICEGIMGLWETACLKFYNPKHSLPELLATDGNILCIYHIHMFHREVLDPLISAEMLLLKKHGEFLKSVSREETWQRLNYKIRRLVLIQQQIQTEMRHKWGNNCKCKQLWSCLHFDAI